MPFDGLHVPNLWPSYTETPGRRETLPEGGETGRTITPRFDTSYRAKFLRPQRVQRSP